jgi:predicted acetyltransferase
MCLDANWQSPDETIAQQIGLATMPEISAEGFLYTPRHAFRAQTGVPGVVYDMVREADGKHIGSAMLLLSDDEQSVMHVGHMGCAIRPEHRKQGHTTRLANALAPVLRQRGIRDLIFGADVGHVSHYESIRNTGAALLGEHFGDGSGKCGARFRLSPSISPSAG